MLKCMLWFWVFCGEGSELPTFRTVYVFVSCSVHGPHLSVPFLLQIILRLAPWTGKMNQTLCCDWLPEWARWNYLALLGLPAVSRKKNFPESYIPLYIYPFHSQKEFRFHLKWCWITVARVRVRWRIRLYQWCCASCFMRRNLTRIYMLFAGCEIHIVKNCDRGLENGFVTVLAWNKIKRVILSRLFPKFVPVEFNDLQTPLSNNEKNIQ